MKAFFSLSEIHKVVCGTQKSLIDYKLWGILATSFTSLANIYSIILTISRCFLLFPISSSKQKHMVTKKKELLKLKKSVKTNEWLNMTNIFQTVITRNTWKIISFLMDLLYFPLFLHTNTTQSFELKRHEFFVSSCTNQHFFSWNQSLLRNLMCFLLRPCLDCDWHL